MNRAGQVVVESSQQSTTTFPRLFSRSPSSGTRTNPVIPHRSRRLRVRVHRPVLSRTVLLGSQWHLLFRLSIIV